MARRRRNLKDLLTPDPTPDKQLAHPSGWCMTLSHEFCPYQFDHGKCGCECHTKTQKTQRASKPVASIVDTPKKRGRPKKVQNIAPTNTDPDYIDPRPWRRKENNV